MALNDDDIDAGQVWWMVPADNLDAEPVVATVTAVHRDAAGGVFSVDVRRESDGAEGGFWKMRPRFNEKKAEVKDAYAGFMRPRPGEWPEVADSVQPFAVVLRNKK